MNKKKLSCLNLKNNFWLLSSILIMWILFSFNTWNPDMENYKIIYQLYEYGLNYNSNNLEIGFKYIFKLCSYFNFSYQQVLMLIATIGLVTILLSSKKYSDKQYIITILFLIFPFFHQVTIIRNFVSLCIFFYAFQFLYKKETKKYIICIIVASLFHISALIYLLYLLSYFDSKSLKKLLIILTVFFLSIVYIPAVKTFVEMIIPKVATYLNDGSMLITKIVLIGYYIGLIILSKMLIKKNLNEDKIDMCQTSHKCLQINILFILLSFLSMNFFRLIENSIILLYIIIANCSFVRNKKLSINSIYVFAFICIQAFIFEVYYSWDTVVWAIINNNSLW